MRFESGVNAFTTRLVFKRGGASAGAFYKTELYSGVGRKVRVRGTHLQERLLCHGTEIEEGTSLQC